MIGKEVPTFVGFGRRGTALVLAREIRLRLGARTAALEPQLRKDLARQDGFVRIPSVLLTTWQHKHPFRAEGGEIDLATWAKALAFSFPKSGGELRQDPWLGLLKSANP